MIKGGMENRDHVAVQLEPLRSRESSPSRPRNRNIELDAEEIDSFDTDTVDRTIPRPPKAEPESDDEDDYDEEIPFTPDARPGVDDGFFPASPHPKPEVRPSRPKDEHDNDPPNGFIPGVSPEPPFRNFPYAPGYGPSIVTINGVATPVPDVNVYQHKKTLAQGMMDLALLSANANQLRYVLESYRRHPYYYVSLVFISISLIFQIAVGIGLILNSRYNIKDQKEICKANKINNLTVVGIFIVTVVNVFISAFGVADPPADMNA